MGISLGGGINYGQHAAIVHTPFIYSGALVVNGVAAPLVYTDLDLSAVVGARRVLVFLKVRDDAAVNSAYTFRPNGDGDNYESKTMGAASLAMNFLVCTDAAGIIEWYRGNAALTSIWVVGYMVAI